MKPAAVWRTKEVKEVIKSRSGVEYSLRDVSRILITMWPRVAYRQATY